jgi:hypothetical protein
MFQAEKSASCHRIKTPIENFRPVASKHFGPMACPAGGIHYERMKHGRRVTLPASLSWMGTSTNEGGSAPNRFQCPIFKADCKKKMMTNRENTVELNQPVKVRIQRTLIESCNIMKRLSLVAVGVGCLLFQNAQATLLFSEAFNYNLGGLNGNVNGSSTWTTSGSAGFNIVSGNLTYAGLADQGGNELQITNGAATSSYITFANQTSGQVYYSFLFDPIAADSANNYFTAMNPGTSVPNGGSDAIDAYYYSSGKIYLRANAASATGGTGTALTPGTTYLIVEMLDLSAHTASLWIDPSSSTFGTLTPPTATATISGTSATITSIDDVGFKAQSAAGGPYLVDNLLIGTTWADVTPTTVPEPTMCALAGLGMLGLVLARRIRK